MSGEAGEFAVLPAAGEHNTVTTPAGGANPKPATLNPAPGGR